MYMLMVALVLQILNLVRNNLGIYALDVTNPDLLKESNVSSVALLGVHREIKHYMGYSFSQFSYL